MKPKEIYAEALKKVTLLHSLRTTVTENQVKTLDAIIADYVKICTEQLELILAELKRDMDQLRKDTP